MPELPPPPAPLYRQAPHEDNPFDDVEELPGLGLAVLWVVLSYVLVSLLLMPARPL